MRLAFSVPGVPHGKERPRVAPGQSRPYTPNRTVAAEKAVRDEFDKRFPNHVALTCPVMLRFTAIFPIPPSWPKYVKEAAARGEVFHVTVPDKDNIEKLIVDALNRVAFLDDGQIQGGGVKRYGSPARIDIVLEAMAQHEAAVTPGQRRREALPPIERVAPTKPRRSNAPKSKFKGKLGAAVDAALARDKAR
jgi:Holliday junction resolvase RusA-like endonuclease